MNKASVLESPDRRKVVKKMVVGAGLLTGYSVLPEQWTRPVVGQMVLPAHAATSGPVGTATSATAEYNTSKVFTLQSLSGNDKKFVWLDETGAAYGKQVKFDFGSCGEFVVPDASVTIGADGTRNHNQAFYFCGTDFPAGAPENLNNRASVFTPPGCQEATVTMYYNKP